MPDKIYEFNEFQLDLSQKTLRKGGKIVAIQPKVFDVLAVLIKRNNEIVLREDLMKEVWGNTFVEETSLRLCIHTLRKIFDGRFIETVPKRGYRFKAEVTESSSETIENKTDAETKLAQYLRKSYKKNTILAISIIAIFGVLTAALFWNNKAKPNEKMTIAVLPFTQLGQTNEQGLAVADAVNTQLNKFTDFQILSSGEHNKNSEAILQGSFREENGLIKVSSSLQNPTTKETIWVEDFEVKPDQDIGVETSIAARLSRLLSLKMAKNNEEETAKNSNVNREALNSYLSARKIWRSRDLGRLSEIGFHLQKVSGLEPNWAFAKSANAESLLMDDNTVTNYEKAEVVAQDALKLDEKQYGALTVLGQVAIYKNWDFAQAEAFFKKAIEINPNYASTYNEYAKLLAYQRNFAEAERMAKRALEIEPFSPLYNTTLCEIYYFDQKIEAALKQCKLTMQIEPDFWLARKTLFWIYVYKKMNKEAAEMILEKYSEDEKMKLPYYKSTQTGDLDDYWRFMLSTGTKTNDSYLRAMFFIQINEKEKAIQSLQYAIEEREWLAFRLNSEPIFEPLWNDNRFFELQKRLKNPQ